MALKDKRDHLRTSRFTNRTKEINFFNELLSNKDIQYNVLNIFGIGGIGKSYLLNYYRDLCNKWKFPIILIECQTSHVVFDALQTIRNQLEVQSDGDFFSEYDKQVSYYLEIQSRLRSLGVNISEGLVSGVKDGVPLGIGALIIDSIGQQKIRDQLERFLSKKDARFIINANQILTEALAKGINELINKRESSIFNFKVFIFFDTYEEADQYFDQWVREVLLESDLNEDHLVLIFSGRDELRGRWQNWNELIFKIELDRFSETDAVIFLERYGIYDSEIQSYLLELTDCLPWALAMMADVQGASNLKQVTQLPNASAAHNVTHKVVDRFLSQINNAQMLELIQVCSVLRWFDRDILHHILSKDSVDDNFSRLKNYSFVKVGSDGTFQIHSIVREYMDKQIKAISSEQWFHIHTKALDFYQEELQGLKLTSWSKIAFAYLYHRFNLENDVDGLNLFFPSKETSNGYYIDYFRPGDEKEIILIDYYTFGDNFGSPVSDKTKPFDLDQRNPDMISETDLTKLNQHNSDMFRVARNSHGKVIGYSCIVPLLEEGHQQVLEGKILFFGLSYAGIAKIPVNEAKYYYIDIIALRDPENYTAGAMLIRDMFNRINPNAKFISTMPNTSYGYKLMEKLGLERKEGVEIKVYAGVRPLYTVNLESNNNKSVFLKALQKRRNI